MDEKIIATYCLCNKLLKAMQHQEDSPCKMSDAEVMTTAFIAALLFRGNLESARAMLKQYGYVSHMLSKSRFIRRLHRITNMFVTMFNLLGNIWKTLNTASVYVIDSLPISVCDNIRILCSKLYTIEPITIMRSKISYKISIICFCCLYAKRTPNARYLLMYLLYSIIIVR